MRPQQTSNITPGNNHTSSTNVVQRKRRRGQIEKRRRDRINLTLIELRRLVPAASEKQGQAKMEKAEILRLTVDYIRELHMRGLGDNWNRLQSAETSETGSATKHTSPPIELLPSSIPQPTQPQPQPQPQQPIPHQPQPQQQQQHTQLQIQSSTTDQQIAALQSSSATMPPMQHQMQQLTLANQLERHHTMAAHHHRTNPANSVVYPYHNHSCEPPSNAIPYYYF